MGNGIRLGLDLGRAAFICMLDLRRSGIPEQLVPPFIHGRYARPLVPERTPEAAARVLENYLATELG